MKQKLLSIFLGFVLVASAAFAQDKRITGKVTAREDGLPLPGVSVKVSGTTIGTQTDVNGNYSINVPSTGKSLEFSFIGFSNQLSTIGTKLIVNVSLDVDAKQLSEVVVTGYQVINKREATGAISIVDAKEIGQKPIVNVTQLLQGTAPGLQVTGGSGRPGSGGFIRIRGVGSINASSEPLIIIDGIQTNAATYAGLNPNDIEQITVLKDAASSAIYGSRAANGVLVITTKQGKKGEPVLSYSFQRGTSRAQELKNVELMNSQQKLQYEFELGFTNAILDSMITTRINSGIFPSGTNLTNLTSAQRQGLWDLTASRGVGNWRDVLLQDAVSNTHEVSLSGANDKIRYYLSLNKQDNEGVEVLSNFDRTAGRLNVDYQAKEWFRIGSSLGVTNTRERVVREPFNTQNLYASTFLYNPYEPLLLTNGSFNNTFTGFSSLEGATNNPQTLDRIVSFGNIFAEGKFFDHLTLKSQLGMNYTTLRSETYLKPGSNLANILGFNQKTDAGNTDFAYVFTNTAGWNQTFNQKHNLNALIGTEFNKNQFYSYNLVSRNFPTASVNTLDNGSTPTTASTTRNDNALISYFGNVTYDFNKKYFLNFSVRRDGSSRFGANNKYANFYAVGAAWDVLSESFIKAKYLSTLKLKGSFGTTGNNGIANYQSLGTYALNVRYNDLPAAVPSRIANPNLTWETSESLDAGVDFGFFNDRLTGEVSYYQRDTKDLLFPVNLSATTGFTSFQGNIGSMRNKGIELFLKGDVVRYKDFKWNLSLSYTHNDNEITSLFSDNVPNGYGRFVVGKPLNTFFLVKWAGVDPQTGKNNYFNIDGTTTTTYNAGQAQLIEDKSPIVKFYGTLGTDFSYKGFDLGVRAYYSGGNYLLNLQDQVATSEGVSPTDQQFTDAFNYWKKPGDIVRFANVNDPTQRITYDTDKYLEKGDYLTLRDATLGYTFNPKMAKYIKAKSLRLFVQGTNLFVITKFRGLPEVGVSNNERNDFPGTFNLYGYPQVSAYTFGVDIKF